MSARRPPRGDLPLRPYVVALAMFAAVAVVTYFAFNPGLPFVEGYRVEAVFQSSNGLREGSPVRVAGVDVGKVVEIRKGPGNTTVAVLEIEDRGQPVHRDASAHIRARVFLEGGFLVELEPGSPSGSELPSGGTIPLPQTTVPVQFHQVLTVFDAPAREQIRTTLDTFATGLADGGAEGLRSLAPELRPLLRDLAWVGEAGRGTETHDLSTMVESTNRIALALDANPDRLGQLVDHLAVTAQAIRSRDADLAASIAELSGVLRATPAAMRAVESALPALESASRRLTPAMALAPRALRESASVLRGLDRLVKPANRGRTLAALETTLIDLPSLVSRLAELFPTAKPMTDCLSSHMIPVLESEVPDGALSTGRPVWQDFAHMLVGLSSASQNFDGNGYALRYQIGLGSQTLSTGDLPVLGPLTGLGPAELRSRPLPRADRKAPPLRSDVPCSSQPLPSLEAPSGSAALRVGGRR
jgi:phospholipid/cholesterol/gamma-HCH transport system substrate-binding protein